MSNIENNAEFNWTMEHINPSMCNTDMFYQRNINKTHLKRLVRDFDINLFNPPVLSKRADGKYYVLDGDHRIAAWKVKCNDKAMLCKVYHGLTQDQEAKLFLAINAPRTVIFTTAAERLNTEYNIKNPEVVDMVTTAKICGVKVDFQKKGATNGRCVAPEALFKVYTDYGREIMIATLKTIMNAWQGDKVSLQSGFIQGIAMFYKLYTGQFESRALVKSLQKNQPIYYLQQARVVSLNGIGKRYCRVFLNEYNKNRTTNRIEDKL